MKIANKPHLVVLLLSTLVGCDQSLEGAELEAEELLLDDSEIDLSALDADDAERVEAWDGLTPEDIALLEYEDGTDRQDPADAIVDLTAQPDVSAGPACLWIQTWGHGWLSQGRVSNFCGQNKRVRFVWRWAIDGACITIPAGGFREERRVRQAKLIRVDEC